METNQSNENNNFNVIIEEFFKLIKLKLIFYINKNNNIENIISKIIEKNENIDKTINNISKIFSNILIKFSRNKKTQKKENEDLNFLFENDYNFDTTSLNKLNINEIELKTFYKVAQSFNIKKIIDKIFEKRTLNSFKIVKGRNGKNNYIIPDEKGNNYQYYFHNSSNASIYVECADSNCEGKLKINRKTNLSIKIHEHSKTFKEHSYVIMTIK